MSPDSGGIAAPNSASGTIGPLACAGSPGVVVDSGFGASGPRAGAVPGAAIWAGAGTDATSAAANQ
jgi:hypothetical protein